ncbi:hypothetical protein [Tenacibaculum sp. SG-28]|uniref:hypothetical protein n=1 Tax=Tenacibaculum sp. SG-28 TaxID=754426 RepID=UPI000CF4EF9C|nr:hypothetical protein [Tenacibaculum sp. SG-28]PQJ23364.1 hypothetical protein BSU00_04000 [Tenacibaculum sp. SG-28]
MNSYDLSRQWFDFSFENPEKVKPIHTAIYFFVIDRCNRLGWKEKFGLPTDMAMEALGIRSYKTYKPALLNLIEWGFIEMVQESKNQFTASIIALVKNTKAHTKAHTKAYDKASTMHTPKQVESTYQSTHQSESSIDKQINKQTNKQINKQTIGVQGNDEFSNLIFSKDEEMFLKNLCEFFSQTTEVLKMRVYSFARAKKQNGEFQEFEKQTVAYMKFKDLTGQEKHNWLNFQRDWQENDWINKLKNIDKAKVKQLNIKKSNTIKDDSILQKMLAYSNSN